MPKEKKDKKNKEQKITLDGVLDIKNAIALHDKFKKVSKAGANLVVDGSKVEKITTPAVQILLASSYAVSQKKGSFKLKSPSNEMKEAFSILGLESQFNEWI